ncbi:hypothetical protein KSD_10890 [Ktedonobacter sp. SOSP1-85]|nr:hypothetical protein KSD_10890 [Ktedonobacter sp. SOSP1-85]
MVVDVVYAGPLLAYAATCRYHAYNSSIADWKNLAFIPYNGDTFVLAYQCFWSRRASI